VRKLSFPIINNAGTHDKSLSMDEYYRFVRFNYKAFFNAKAYRDVKKISPVNVFFSF